MTSVLAFVILDAYEGVLTYDELRSNGFIGNTLEKEYVSGAHGINGLINIMGNPPVKKFLDDHEFKVAKVTTPWFKDGSLLGEPEAEIQVVVEDEHPHLVELRIEDNVTKLCMPDCEDYDEYLSVMAKVSVMMATSTYPVLDFDLLGALDPEFAPKPAMKATKGKKPSVKPAPLAPEIEIPMPSMPQMKAAPAPEQASVPATPAGGMLDNIRNMHKQIEETARQARERKAPAGNPNVPLHKQMFGLF